MNKRGARHYIRLTCSLETMLLLMKLAVAGFQVASTTYNTEYLFKSCISVLFVVIYHYKPFDVESVSYYFSKSTILVYGIASPCLSGTMNVCHNHCVCHTC